MALPLGHRPQLDGLRTLAVFSVALFHWEHPEIAGRGLALGFLGVGVFFVLSGYLITGVLIGVRTQAEQRGLPVRGAIVPFYARRLLRLAPALYVYLFVVWALGIIGSAADLPWYLLYAGNLKATIDQGWFAGTAHLWTLAVEEQFYAVMPLVVLLLKPRLQVVTFLAIVGVGLVAPARFDLLPPAAFMGLSVGCLLALAAASFDPKRLDVLARLGLPGLALWFLSAHVLLASRGGAVVDHAVDLLGLVSMAGIVWYAARGGSSLIDRFLESRIMVWLGGISYGLYLWHEASAILLKVATDGRVHELPAILSVPLFSALTVLLAVVSARLVEAAPMQLKDRFPYLPKPEVVASAPVGRSHDRHDVDAVAPLDDKYLV